MAESKRLTFWEPFAYLLCQTANLYRDNKKKSKPFTPLEFIPGLNKPKQQRLELDEEETKEALKLLFCRR